MRPPSRVRKAGRRPLPSASAERAFFYSVLFILIAATMSLIYLYDAGYIGVQDLTIYSSISLSLLMPAAVFAYMARKGLKWRGMLERISLAKGSLNPIAARYGIGLFLAILMAEALLGLFSQLTHIPLPTNVDQLLGGMPLWFLAFAVLITPFNEEIFFRGFLVKALAGASSRVRGGAPEEPANVNVGIVAAGLVFSLLHLGYGSVSEFAGALLFGILAGYVYLKSGSLYSTILAHLLVNLLAIASVLAVR